jgi:hypothetical protein
MIEGAATCAVASLLPGCGASSTPGTTTTVPTPPATNPQPVPTGALTVATLGVTAVSTGTIGAEFIGLSTDKLNLTEEPMYVPSNTNLAALFKLIKVGVLRFGDGSQDVWTPSGPGQIKGQVAPADVNNLASFLTASECQCIYGLNMGGYGPIPTGNTTISPNTDGVPTTTALAAAEAAYVSQKLGSSLYAIEIGNEPDGYINTFWYNQSPKWGVSVLETVWSTFQSAIVGSTPGIPILGPSCGTVSPVVSVWTQPFGLAEGSKLTALTQHYYRGNGQASPLPTAAQCVSYPDTTLIQTFLTPLQQTAQTIGKPYRISECNSYYNGGAANVSDAYASSLWVIDFMYTCAQYGAAGVNFHGGSDTNYEAITDTNGIPTGVRPLYYGILMFALAGQGTLYTCNLGAGSLNVSAFAVKTSTGLNIIINNKDPAQNLEVAVTVPQTVNTATLMVMTQATSGVSGPNLSALSGVTIQGATVGANASFAPSAAYTLTTAGTQFIAYVPYLSAVLIQIT